MANDKGNAPPIEGLSRRTLLKLTGAAVVGSVIGCSDEPAQNLPLDAAAAPDLEMDLGADVGVDSAPPVDLTLPDQPQPDSAVVKALPGPIFFVHFTDIHIGSGSLALPSLDYGLKTVLPSFPSVPVVATGDLCETGNDVKDWADYKKAIDGAKLKADDYIEVPGNHDGLLDGALNNYVKYTLAGRTAHGTNGLYHRVHQGRRIRIIALNTCSGGNVIMDSTGYLKGTQVDGLLTQIANDPVKVDATIVLGHHPPTAPMGLALLGTDKHLRRLLKATSAAAYLHGHMHMYYVNWEGKTLMAQAPSLGNPSEGIPGATVPGFNIFALDQGPVARVSWLSGDKTNVSAKWPQVMITRPADLNLGKKALSSSTNPWAAALTKNSTGNVLHAGVFAPIPILTVRYRLDGGAWLPMKKVSDYYRAEFTAPNKATCQIEVQGQATTGAARSDKITVALS